jgi:hypothetical protein
MERNEFISNLKNIALKYYKIENNINLSKALGFYFLKKYIETTKFHIDDYDILNSNVDAANDRGFDNIYFDDYSDDVIKVYIIQSKVYSDDSKVDENEVSKYILNFNKFPNLIGNTNKKLENAINQYKMYDKNLDYKIEKIGIYINIGKFTTNALKQLEHNGIEIFDFERINNELFMSQYLPDFNIKLKRSPTYYEEKSSFLGILKVGTFLDDTNIQKIIKNQSIFQYNVRGLMKFGKHSVAYDIKETIKNNPSKLFLLNNGITITCEALEKENAKSYNLIKGSIVNGQQTIRSILSIWGDIDNNIKKQLFVAVKVLVLDSKSENFHSELINVARSTNKQNAIKDSDLHSTDGEQVEIEENSIYLPEPLKFFYKPKKSIEKSDLFTISSDEAIVLLNTFFNLNPSDSIEALYRNQYKKIFTKIKPEYISIVQKLREMIGIRQEKQDNNNKSNMSSTNTWKDDIYVKFKKHRTINYSLYLFSLILDKKFFYSDSDMKKQLLDKIYNNMKNKSNYNINVYFNNDFWQIFMLSTKRFLKKLYEDKNIGQDFLRRPLNIDSAYNIKSFLGLYDDFIDQKTSEGEFNPRISMQ